MTVNVHYAELTPQAFRERIAAGLMSWPGR